MNKWNNYGDVNFLDQGGCLVKKDEYEGCYNVISLMTPVCDYHGKYKKPCIVSRCFVDITDWMSRKNLQEINSYAGYPDSFKPKSEEEKEQFAADLIGYYGIGEFDPCFPEVTKCSPYGWNFSDAIVGKAVAASFLKDCGVPYEWRH